MKKFHKNLTGDRLRSPAAL